MQATVLQPRLPALPRWASVLLSNRRATLGLALLALIVLPVAAAPLLAGPAQGDISLPRQPPTWHHVFGTTDAGMDVFAQVVWGGRPTLVVVLAATLLGISLAVAFGVVAGAIGGIVDTVLSTIVNAFLVVPIVPLVVLVAAVLPGNSWPATVVMVGAASWAGEARILRAQALALRELDFLHAARISGESRLRVIWSELLPNMAPRIAAGVCFVAIQVVLLLSTLFFLGYGQLTDESWGRLLSDAFGASSLESGAWWIYFFPSLALVLLAVSLVLLLQGLEEIADPRLGGRAPRGRLRLHLPALRRPSLPRPSVPVPSAEALAACATQLVRRLPVYLVALWVAATACFLIPSVLPRSYGWHGAGTGPILTRYAHFLWRLATLHFPPESYPGLDGILRSSIPLSLLLVGCGTILAFVAGTTIGAVAAWRRGGAFDATATTATAALWAIPAFVIGGLALSYTALRFGWFPIAFSWGTDVNPGWNAPFARSVADHAALPILVVATSSVGYWAVSMRAMMAMTVNADYVALARAQGLPDRKILLRYAARNAVLPVLAGFGVAFGAAVGGLVAIEQVFSYVGAGWEFEWAAGAGDLDLLQALFLAFAVAVCAVNLFVDVLLVGLDPRLRKRGGSLHKLKLRP
ncbi:MAG TPA: ABC transporter permease subunit [Gaiellaceae bacterium]|nr:ABC transporter permease subunit [Gaiellaceae bacterium]